MKRRLQHTTSKSIPFLVILILLLVWQLFSMSGLTPKFMLPSPVDVVRAFIVEFPLLMEHGKATLAEAFLGLVCGIVLAFLAAVLMDRFPLVYKGMYPVIVLTQTIPTIAIAPLLVLWMGYEMAPKIVLITPKDMEGFSYATWDMEVEKAILRYVMEKDGGAYEGLNMIPSTVTDVVTALNTDVDLVWIYYAWDGIAAETQGIETNYINLADVDEALDFYSPVIIANDDYLESNPREARAFLAAVKKGYEFAMENPKEAAAILCEAVPELDKEIVAESQRWLADKYQVDAESWGVIDGARWDGFYRWLYDNGAIDREIPEGVGYTNEYLR